MNVASSPQRSTQIQSIIDSRKPMAELAKSEIVRLGEVASQLSKLLSFINSNKNRVDETHAQKLESVASEIVSLRMAIDEAGHRFNLLEARFTRKSLNIGVVGRARQGKSTLLQRITGLTDGEIPTGSEGHCTGAASVIENHDEADARASVRFYTETLFLENVIRPFVEQLKPGYENLGSPPSSLDEFANFVIPELPGPKSLDPATDVERLKKLKGFQDSLKDYRNNLTGEVKPITRDKIRSFVAQQDESGAPQHHWRAVHLVHVWCKFPHPDVGRIALVDTPGLGDFISGAEDRLVDTVGKNLDIVAFLRRPPQVGGHEPADTNLHSLITRAIRDLNTADWSYFIINQEEKTETRNRYFREALESSGIKTRLVLEATCTNTEHVSQLLEKVLGDVAKNLGNLDQRLLQIAKDRTRDIWENLRSFIAGASKVIPKAAPSNEKELKNLFLPVWNAISNQLRALVEKYKKLRGTPDEEFQLTLRRAVKDLENAPETMLSDDFGGGDGSIYFPNKMHEMRVHLAQNLGQLDIELESGYTQLRQEILQIFSEQSGGRLSFLNGLPDKEALSLLLEKWRLNDGEQSSPVVEGIELLLSDGLSYRGWVQPRIRRCLDILDPDHKDGIPYARGEPPSVVNADLKLAWSNACYSIYQEVEKVSHEPSISRFALVQDFKDLILFKGGSQEALNRWELFYGGLRCEVWPEEFGSLEHKVQFINGWNQHIESLQRLLPTNI